MKILKHKILSYKVSTVLLFVSLILLTACGTDPAIESYKANMNQFFENIEIYDTSINAIDPNSETATAELMTLLDSMNTTFSQMASLDVPEGFPGVEQLADEASTYMSDAVACYHQAYDGEYDSVMEDVAFQHYQQANIRFQYIVSILHGDIPEEIFTYEDEGSSDGSSPEDLTDEEEIPQITTESIE
ncbi:MAG: hypothetical protein IJ409_00310 [Lachnospiraceae bacterium]|nr:hypothetical protein [Lachnospiraceae bacterium]